MPIRVAANDRYRSLDQPIESADPLAIINVLGCPLALAKAQLDAFLEHGMEEERQREAHRLIAQTVIEIDQALRKFWDPYRVNFNGEPL
jgi:hypothetical protein